MSGSIRNDWRGFWWRPFGGRGIAVEWDRPWLYGEMSGGRRVFRIGRLAIALLPSIYAPRHEFSYAPHVIRGCRNCFFNCREPHACHALNGRPHPKRESC